jgi:hypothetical protein
MTKKERFIILFLIIHQYVMSSSSDVYYQYGAVTVLKRTKER